MLSFHRRKTGCGEIAIDPSADNEIQQPTYQCEFCTYKTYRKGCLQTHFRLEHRDSL